MHSDWRSERIAEVRDTDRHPTYTEAANTDRQSDINRGEKNEF